MALIKCPECDNEVSSFATSCPKCGYPIANKVVGNSSSKDVSKIAQVIVWFSGFIGIVGIIGIIGGIFKYAEWFFPSVCLIIVAIFIYGFSYIVQAAYLYILSQSDNEENE